MDNYDMERAMERLYQGESIQKICSFYNVSIDDLNKIAQEKGYKNIRSCIKIKNSNKNKTKIKPRDERLLTVARAYIRKGKSFDAFLKDLRASERPFSEEQIQMAENLFEISKKKEDEKKQMNNDEVEM